MVKIMPLFLHHLGEMGIQREGLWRHRKFCLLLLIITSTIIIYIYILLINVILLFRLSALNSVLISLFIRSDLGEGVSEGHLP